MAGWSICFGWRRLWSAFWVPSCPVDTWHFKRGLAALSPDEVTPGRWGSAALPSVFMISAQWGGKVEVHLGSDSKFRGFRHKATGFGAVGVVPPNQEPQPHSR